MSTTETNEERRRAIGSKLKAYRTTAGLSQRAVAGLAKIEQTTVSQYERGLRDPSPGILEKLASALDLEPADLEPGIEPVTPEPVPDTGPDTDIATARGYLTEAMGCLNSALGESDPFRKGAHTAHAFHWITRTMVAIGELHLSPEDPES